MLRSLTCGFQVLKETYSDLAVVCYGDYPKIKSATRIVTGVAEGF